MSLLTSTARGFRRSPGFFLLAILTLGLGIGANSAIFTVVNAVLIRPLPYSEPERLVSVMHTAPGVGFDKLEHSEATWLLYRKHNKVLEDLGIFWDGSVALTGGPQPERVGAAGMSPSVFGILRVPPALGRALIEEDGGPEGEKVLVLSHGLWQRLFSGDAGAIGRTLRVDGVARQVVGVMPEGFHFPNAETELWLPLVVDPANASVGNFNYPGIARLRPGVSIEQAHRDLSALIWRIPEEFPSSEISRGMLESAKMAMVVKPYRDEMVGDLARTLWLLLGSVGIILLIAGANVANLYLVRAEGRQREVAVRTAIGATRGEIARVFLLESVGLALIGGLLGLALATGGVRLLLALQPEGIPRLEEIGIDGAVVAFTLLLSLLLGLFIGGFATLRYGSPDLVPALKDGGRGGTAGKARHRARQVLVVAQVALALLLLVGAGLMLKSFWGLADVDPGVKPEGVLTLRLDLPEPEYPDVHVTARFVGQLLEKVRAIPGVERAGTVNVLPLTGFRDNSTHSMEDHPLPPDTVPPVLGTRFISPGYFEAMGIPLLEGKGFDRIDPQKRSGEVLVSKSVADRFWPGRSPLGRRLTPGLAADGRWATIVGVVGDVREEGLHKPVAESVYYPLVRLDLREEGEEEWVPRSFALVVKSKGDPNRDPISLAKPVQRAIWSLNPNLALAQVRSMSQVVERSMARTSFTLVLLAIGAAVALLLGAVGIYGVISYVVSQRTQEIGVRMALGAKRADVSGMILKEGLALALLGIGLGLAGALAVTRFMQALLFEVSTTDPATFAAVPLLLAAVALLASYLPARRAAGVEPLEAIRYE
ncbi:MAG: putative transport system permease protein [Acidobacteriota bacterium]|jgi:predicted permease|nr:putative transport system permease protein [Acidobacteriota bacterium]